MYFSSFYYFLDNSYYPRIAIFFRFSIDRSNLFYLVNVIFDRNDLVISIYNQIFSVDKKFIIFTWTYLCMNFAYVDCTYFKVFCSSMIYVVIDHIDMNLDDPYVRYFKFFIGFCYINQK